MESTSARVEEFRNNKEYLEALLLLSTAREPVDAFFDKVMVMVEDEKVRANRLALLRTLLKEFSTIADFSEIVTERQGVTRSCTSKLNMWITGGTPGATRIETTKD